MTTFSPGARHYDAVIAGARCAGAATALLLARAGLRVLVVDRGRPGTDTLSTHALMRGGVLQLARWGVLPDIVAAGTPPVRQTTFVYGRDRVTVAIKPRDGLDALYAPRRTVLDRHLVEHARAAGAEFAFGSRLVDLAWSVNGRVRGAAFEDGSGARHQVGAGIVVGADGLRSTVAALTGAATYREGRHASATVYAHWGDIDVDGYGWYYGERLSAGAIATNGGAVVFAAVPSGDFSRVFAEDLDAGYRRVLAEVAPDVAARLDGARRLGPLRGFPGHPGVFRQSWGPGWALVGDAGYFKDPLTAHGITDALRDAELLARAIAAGSDQALAAYQATRDTLAGPVFDVTDAIASFEWTLASVPALHRALSRAMADEIEAIGNLGVAGHQPRAVSATM
ncbi:MAG: NAD(P)/FAD-dependent oxidoreductase [Vicinamibacterales bacterium]